jgi:UDP-glucose 4-epimerase
MVEKILGWYGVTKGLRSVSLRYFNAAGASTDALIGEDWTFSINLVPVVMKATLGRRPPVQVFGADYPTPDGTCIRDYIHVDDLAKAHIAAIDHLLTGGPSEVFNVGTGLGFSVREVMAAVENVTGRPVPHLFGPRRDGDPAELVADSSKLRARLGWNPDYSTLHQIVASAWPSQQRRWA